MSCEEARLDLGGYVLGALDAGERREVEQHLAGCPDCRAEVVRFADIHPLLGRLSEADVAGGTDEPSPDLLTRLLARVGVERRRRRARTLVAVAAAVAVAVAGAGVSTAVVTAHHGTPAVVSTAQTAEGVSATARMSTAGARTAISLSIGGVTAGQRCRLIAVDQNGREQVLGEWTVNYTGSAEVRAASDGPPSRLRQLLVRTVDGRQLAALPVPA